MNVLTIEKKIQIIDLLINGNSMRSISQVIGCSINTIAKLLTDVGRVCNSYQDRKIRNLDTKHIQYGPTWAFTESKEKGLYKENTVESNDRDTYIWTAIDADTKLVISFMLSNRDANCAARFIDSLAIRLNHHFQLSPDSRGSNLEAIESGFQAHIDHASLIEIYGVDTKKSPNSSSALPNTISKKTENLKHAVALHFMYYNFSNVHKALHVTPAMEAGISDHIWTVEDIVGLFYESHTNK